jgi:hypothetical protein
MLETREGRTAMNAMRRRELKLRMLGQTVSLEARQWIELLQDLRDTSELAERVEDMLKREGCGALL